MDVWYASKEGLLSEVVTSSNLVMQKKRLSDVDVQVKEWYNAGKGVNNIDKWGNTPLYYACLCGHANIVSYLLTATGVKGK